MLINTKDRPYTQMIIMTLLVRDEQDIIATNIEYHLSQGIDLIIVTNNLSIDKTPAILKKYVSSGDVHLINENSDNYAQHKWVTYMAEIAVNHYNADWILHCDADEFWIPDDHSKTLKTVLTELSDGINVGSAKRVNFLPPRHSEEEQYFVHSMNIREIRSLNAIGQPIPPKICHRGLQNIIVKQGNHHVEVNGERLMPAELPITIYHYPLRSYAQFENKIKLGGAAYERNTDLEKCIGSTWRSLYQLYKKGELESYYMEQRPDKQSILKGLESGQFVKDSTLLNYIIRELDYKKLSKIVGNLQC